MNIHTTPLQCSDKMNIQYSTSNSDMSIKYDANSEFRYKDDEVFLDVDTTGRSACQKCSDALFPAGFSQEFKKMVSITWPICVTQICQMIIGPVSLIFCGHLGDAIKLDGSALAISMINATCIAVGQGLGTACDTFFSQSYGSKNRKKMGMYLQRAVLIFMMAIIVCVSININMELLLRLLGQHPEVSKAAGSYMLLFIPGAFAFFLYIILSKFLQNQNIVYPNVIIGIIANGVNAILHYLFLYQWDYGIEGSAVAQSISYVLFFVLTLIYILISNNHRDTWDGWSTECLQDWGQFAKLAVPGMLMVCLEWWGFEIGVFLTGLLGVTELGAQAVLLQIDSIWFQIPLGIQIATSIRIGQYLGSGSKLGAITAARLGIFLVTILSIVMAGLFLIFRYDTPKLFTNVTAIAELTGDLLPIVCLYMFFDGVATACKGVLYGTGRQIIGAVILFVSYYLLALPAGVPLMFYTSLRSAAYWWALAFNLVLQAAVLCGMVYRTNWEDQIKQAQERAGLLGEYEDQSQDEKDALLPRKDSNVDTPAKRVSRRESNPSRPRSYSRGRVLSVSLSTTEIKALMTANDREPLRQVLLKRLLCLVIMICILAGAIACRVFVEIPPYPISNSTTAAYDVTTSSPQAYTTQGRPLTTVYSIGASLLFDMTKSSGLISS